MTQLGSFQDLLESQVQDLLSAEKQFLDALPKLASSASSSELKDAFQEHERITREQIKRLEEMASSLGVKMNGKTCQGAKGLVKEGDEVMKAGGDPMVMDAALIAAAQRVEHYEIAGYGTLAALAKQAGNKEAAKLAAKSLEEEREADEKLSKIAERFVNEEAAS